MTKWDMDHGTTCELLYCEIADLRYAIQIAIGHELEEIDAMTNKLIDWSCEVQLQPDNPKEFMINATREHIKAKRGLIGRLEATEDYLQRLQNDEERWQ